MAILHNNVVPFVGGEYTIDQSLRFEDGSSAFLSRTPASAGNRKTWTWSGWVKRGNLGTNNTLFAARTAAGATYLTVGFDSADDFRMQSNSETAYPLYKTNALFRDASAWYHCVVSLDMTQATSTDRLKVWINGVLQSTASYNVPAQNTDLAVNSTETHLIGQQASGSYHDGYLAEVHFIDGQALTPDSFGEVDETYGHWKPIRYTGTYGTNGFYLPFSGTFYNDASGNGNNWTANNLATTDVVLDSPTNNFATLNPLDNQGLTLSNGNLNALYASAAFKTSRSTIGMTSGKWYFEAVANETWGYGEFGVMPTSGALPSSGYIGASGVNGYAYQTNGYLYSNDVATNSGISSVSSGDVMVCAVDIDAGKIWFGKNGSWFNSGAPEAGTNAAYTTLSGSYSPAISIYNGASGLTANFGQDSTFAGNKTAQNNTDDNGYGDFYYAPPSGFLALCTANLSDPAVVPGENFNTVLYTGNSSTNAITGVGFQPDFTWIKARTDVRTHMWYDVIRGAGNYLTSNNTNAEGYASTFNSFDTDGFTVSGTDNYINNSNHNYVSWNWKADNTSGSTNTDGSITSTVAANVDAGFSIVSYTGNATAGATVGHGLSQAPDVVIVKNRDDGTRGWMVYHSGNTAAPETDYLFLNSTNATSDYEGAWNDNAPTSTVFSLGNSNETNQSTANHIAYAFHSVDGYSKFGSYTGNGSSDGPFVFTNFRPAFVICKVASGATGGWNMFDNERDPYNEVNGALLANLSNAEDLLTTQNDLDFCSNGFKIRESNNNFNGSGHTFIYMAFAEFPFSVGGGIAR